MDNRMKIFKERGTLFEHLREVDPLFRNIYAVSRVLFGLFVLYIISRDSFQAKRLHLDISVSTVGNLAQWWTFAKVECFLLFGYVLMYMTFLVWLCLTRCLGRAANVLCFTLHGIFVGGSLCAILYTMDHTAPIPRLAAMMELLKVSLKSYSFLCENMRKVLHPWNKDDDSGPAVWYAGQMSPQVGSFSQYMYFLLLPTVLYRDHYPQNRSPFMWSNVALHIMQFLGACIVAKWLLLEFQYPLSMRREDLIQSYLSCLLCSPLVCLLVSIIIFNSWCNLMAETTRFGDREFYQSWWTAVGYSEYHRRWNIVIYDFFRTYIYQELAALLPYRPLAALFVLVLSAVMHDLYFGIAMGFFLPAFMFLYALMGGIVLISGVKFSKLMTFVTICFGFCLFEIVYYTELAARHYCPAEEGIGKFEIRTFHCYQKYNY